MQTHRKNREVFKQWWDIWTSKIIVSQAEVLNPTEEQKQQDVHDALQMRSEVLNSDPAEQFAGRRGSGP
jgi:hypothetical protein